MNFKVGDKVRPSKELLEQPELCSAYSIKNKIYTISDISYDVRGEALIEIDTLFNSFMPNEWDVRWWELVEKKKKKKSPKYKKFTKLLKDL